MKPLILALLLLVPVSAAAQDRVIRQYDRFEDRTSYWTQPAYVRIGLEVRGHFSFKGKGAGHDVNEFSLIFVSRSSDWRYLKDSHLRAVIDGKSLDLGSASARDGNVQPGYSSVQVEEKLLFSISYQTLQRISQAKEVDMRLGSTEFFLGPDFRESLKELLGKVQVVKKK